MEGRSEESSSVGVALRVRPLNNKEKNEGSGICLSVDTKIKVITIGSDRTFTFDQVFGIESTQDEVFQGCAKDLVMTVFKGYNATILAYGQTGSGKTYTMGSGRLTDIKQEDIGIIPRVISLIFEELEKRKSEAEFVVKINFIEIYNEEIHDLLNKSGITTEKNLAIRERAGSIVIDGLSEEIVVNVDNTLKCLEDGSLQRSVASTLMNSQSSRSHAIFTINIDYQTLPEKVEEAQAEKWMSKFHFVDLAGSERAKRTGASGATLKEGISINKGLLCLGNVISALTEESKKSQHIPYRDSKLTRILQDSLGGNANTFMIACASPSDTNFEETLNTLKYASRARHIKNKPVVNTDPHSAMIASLREEISSLKIEIQKYHIALSSSNNEDIKSILEGLKNQTTTRAPEGSDISTFKAQQLEKRLSAVTAELEVARQALQAVEIDNFRIKKERDLFKDRIDKYMDILRVNNIPMLEEDETSVKLVDEYLEQIEKLKKDKESKDIVIKDLEYEYTHLMKEYEKDRKLLDTKTQELERLKSKGIRAGENLEEILNKNVGDYGRMFAETVFATMEKPEASQSEEIEESTEIVEEFEAQETELNTQKEEIVIVECKIKEKEEKLKNIESAFKDMQAKLLEEMSNQYYKKIQEIQIELKNTERERDMAMEKSKEVSGGERKSVSDKFGAKIQTLERQLQENMKKDREMTNLHKLLESQKSQLTKMNEEIKKEKKQKVELQKKYKEEKDQFLKMKTQKAKEFLLLKRSEAKKDQEIKILKSENMKKDIIAKRKTEELAALQKRQRDIALKRKPATLAIGIDTLKEWIKEYAKACVEEKESMKLLNKEVEEKDVLEEDLKDLYTSYNEVNRQQQKLIDLGSGNYRVRPQRNEHIPCPFTTVFDHEPNIDLDELYSKIESSRRESQEILDEIEILEEKINFKQNKIVEYTNKLANSRVEEIKSRGATLNSQENSQNLISLLFDEVLIKFSKIRELKKKLAVKDGEVEDLQAIFSQMVAEKEIIKKTFENEIIRMQQELHEKTEIIVKITEESGKSAEDIEELTEKNEEIKKLKDRMDGYVNKYNKLYRAYNEMKDGEYDKSKPRHSYNSVSLTKARDKHKKNKIILGAHEEGDKDRLLNPRVSIGYNSTQNLKPVTEDDSVFERLQRSFVRSRTTLAPDYCYNPSQKWEQVAKVEAHEGPIVSMFNTESMLYTGSNQKLKIWNLEDFSYIGEVPAHTSFIRSMVYWPEKSTFFTCSGSIVNMYDTFTLNKAFTFRGHNDEIRTMKAHDNFLICAGKGNPNSLFVWDMRKMDIPVCEKEKNLDIFSIVVHNGMIYYGCRDHKVHRMKFADFEVVKPFETSHYDSITALTIYNDTLISGSRDKNLRIWNQDSGNEIKTIISAHPDWVNALATDINQRGAYSGGKEGKIRVWKGQGNDINYSGELLGHSASVNCLSSIPTNTQTLISASSDKTFRVWKLEEDSEVDDD